jgi:hypothetical protein
MPYSPNVDPGRYDSYTANIKDFGALGDGVSDDTVPITNAISAAHAHGGGNVVFPPGTYITGTQLLYSKVHLIGAGIETTILLLKSGANGDLLQGSVNGYGATFVNVNASNASGSTGGIYNWSVRDMTLDGNKSNQSGGPSYGMRFYGFGFLLLNLRVRSGYSGGVLADWNGGGNADVDSMEAQVENVKVHDCGGIGLEWGGPHDSQFSNLLVFKSGSHNIHIGPNASAVLMSNCHSFGPASGNSSVGFLLEAGYGQYANCLSEGSDTCNVVLLASEITWVGGHIFGAGTFNVTGMQFGQNAGGTPYSRSANQSAGVTTAVTVGGCLIHSIFSHNEGANGALWFVNDGGNNFVQGCFFQNSGKIVSGTINPATTVHTSSNGLTADGSIGKGGIFRLPINANQAFLVSDRTNDILNINTSSKKLELVNGAVLRTYTDAYSTESFVTLGDSFGSVRFGGDSNATIARRAAGVLAFGGTIALAQSSSAQALATSGTISLSNVGVVRVAPTADVTGIKLTAGSYAGQLCTVVNESAYTVTFDIAANSFVADGVSNGMLPNTAKMFVWSNGTNLWYGMF